MRRLKELAHGLPIVWHGMVRETDVLNRLYQRASIFAYPSLAEKGETFGLSVLEAMAWGCVPVVSDLACFRDFVKDRENGRGFNHRDSNRLEALANTFSDLTITGNNRAQLQERARNVRKTHSLDSISDAFLDDFKSILSM